MKTDELPDYRNTRKGNAWLRGMIENVRTYDDALRLIASMAAADSSATPRGEREPGEEG